MAKIGNTVVLTVPGANDNEPETKVAAIVTGVNDDGSFSVHAFPRNAAPTEVEHVDRKRLAWPDGSEAQ